MHNSNVICIMCVGFYILNANYTCWMIVCQKLNIRVGVVSKYSPLLFSITVDSPDRIQGQFCLSVWSIDFVF